VTSTPPSTAHESDDPRPSYVRPAAEALGELTIQRCFEEQADRTPDAIAVEDAVRRLSYRELDSRANALCHVLVQAGLAPGELVGVLLERSLAAIIGMLAILKAGGAYLPLDPGHPRDHLRTLLADAGARLVLVAPGSVLAQDLSGITAVDVDESRPQTPEVARRPRAGGPEDLAYVMYTSGSTGVPKGVEILHRGVLRLVVGADYAELAGETFLQLAPLAFDAATFEVWGALLNGGRLVVMTGQATPVMIRRAIATHRVTTLWLTAGLFQLLADGPLAELQGLRQLLAGGDVLSVTHVRRVMQGLPRLRLINGYGPTENTTFTCCHTVTEPLGATVPIGRPIHGTTVAILDDQLRPLPAGTIGEICTGGDGLARGYRGRPGQTKEAFVTVPGADGTRQRLYRTGDLGLMRPDGVVEFISRTDRQVKIRGNRVEIGEIEITLLRHPLLRAALVVAAGGDARERALHAYVVPRGQVAPTAQELRDFLSALLPPFMVPAAFVVLDALPLTANGKIDRAALPAVNQRSASARLNSGASELTPLERQLLAVCAGVLKVSDLTRDDSLGSLGVNSLTAAHLVDEIQRACGRAPALTALTEETTVRQLARMLSEGGGGPSAQTVLRLHEQGGGEPFFYLHGDMLGSGLYSHHLAEVLGSEVPFYALPTCQLGHTQRSLSVSEMAELHLQTLRSLRPSGPYRLGGYCNGGVIATAMAQLLRAQGEQVSILVLIDAEAAYPRLWRCRLLAQLLRLVGAGEDRRIAAFRRIANTTVNATALPTRGLRLGGVDLGRVAGVLKRAVRRITAHASDSGGGGVGEQRDILSAYMWEVAAFRAQPGQGRVVLLLSDEYAVRQQEITALWRQVTDDLAVRTIPGDHTESISVNIGAAAAAMHEALNAGGKPPAPAPT
jgi:amino acid adenylation domain-containing protein